MHQINEITEQEQTQIELALKSAVIHPGTLGRYLAQFFRDGRPLLNFGVPNLETKLGLLPKRDRPGPLVAD